MNKAPIPQREDPPKLRKPPLSPETIRGLQELGVVFRQIHRRLVAEGYVIRDGKITKPGSADDHDGTKREK